MVEEVMVVLIILPIGLMSRKWTCASKKIKTKKEMQLIESSTAEAVQTITGHLGHADNSADAEVNEVQTASLVAGSFTLRLRELARARDLVGVEQLAREMRA